MGKSSLRQLPIDHFRTLRNASNNQVAWRDVTTQIGLPVGVGLIVWIFDARLSDVTGAVAGVSIVAGLLFSMAIFLFQLRITIEGPQADQQLGSADFQLIDECMANTLWAILCGLSLTLYLVVCGAGRWINNPGPGPILTGVATAAALHFLLVIMMCLKRLRRAYQRIGMKKQ